MIEVTVDVEPTIIEVFILDDEGTAVDIEVTVPGETVDVDIEVNE